MKNLIDTFKKTIYNPSFYQHVGDVPFKEAFRFYRKCTLVFSVVMTVALAIFFIPVGTLFINKYAPDLIKNYYPEKLVIHIEKGQASADVPMPYFVPIRTLGGATTTVGLAENLLVVDTTHDFERKIFESYKTYALLTKTDLVTSNDKGQITIQPLRGAPTTTISQELLLSWVDKIHQSLGTIIAIAIVAVFVILALGYLLYLLPLLLFALVPYFIAWIRKTPLTYRAAYKMSLYAIVPALAVKTVLNLVGLFFLPSYLTFLVFMLVVAINMRDTDQLA
jgi:hypothetical protein